MTDKYKDSFEFMGRQRTYRVDDSGRHWLDNEPKKLEDYSCVKTFYRNSRAYMVMAVVLSITTFVVAFFAGVIAGWSAFETTAIITGVLLFVTGIGIWRMADTYGDAHYKYLRDVYPDVMERAQYLCMLDNDNFYGLRWRAVDELHHVIQKSHNGIASHLRSDWDVFDYNVRNRRMDRVVRSLTNRVSQQCIVALYKNATEVSTDNPH